MYPYWPSPLVHLSLSLKETEYRCIPRARKGRQARLCMCSARATRRTAGNSRPFSRGARKRRQWIRGRSIANPNPGWSHILFLLGLSIYLSLPLCLVLLSRWIGYIGTRSSPCLFYRHKSASRVKFSRIVAESCRYSRVLSRTPCTPSFSQLVLSLSLSLCLSLFLYDSPAPSQVFLFISGLPPPPKCAPPSTCETPEVSRVGICACALIAHSSAFCLCLCRATEARGGLSGGSDRGGSRKSSRMYCIMFRRDGNRAPGLSQEAEADPRAWLS